MKREQKHMKGNNMFKERKNKFFDTGEEISPYFIMFSMVLILIAGLLIN
jgi:hypothetical protein